MQDLDGAELGGQITWTAPTDFGPAAVNRALYLGTVVVVVEEVGRLAAGGAGGAVFFFLGFVRKQTCFFFGRRVKKHFSGF